MTVSNGTVSDELLLRTYTDMVRSRHLDVALIGLVAAGKLHANWHSGFGEEALCGVYTQLRKDDYAGYTHRGCYAWVSKGIPMRAVLAEFQGKATGTAKGKGGTHIADLERGVLGRSAMQGGHFPLFAGVGIAIQQRGSDQVAICSFGEGAATSGNLHEAMNFSSVWKLPVVFVCENNTCSETERLDDIWGQPDISKMGIPYGMPFATTGENDAIDMTEMAAEAIHRARTGGGPTILELKTFRMRAHFEQEPPDFPDRSKEEIAEWAKKDPIDKMQKALLERQILTQDLIESIDRDARAELEEALRFAEESPPASPDEAFTDIYGNLSYEKAR